VRWVILPAVPLLGALLSLYIAFVFGPYWWTLLPLIAGIAWPLAKGKGEKTERFDDKKTLTSERTEYLFEKIFKEE
jgi:hypothetical protein